MKTGLLAFLLLSGVTVTARYTTAAATKSLHDAVTAGAYSPNVIAGRGALEDYHYAIEYLDANICERNNLRYAAPDKHGRPPPLIPFDQER